MTQVTVDILFLEELIDYFETLRKIAIRDEDNDKLVAMANAFIDMPVDQLKKLVDEAELQ